MELKQKSMVHFSLIKTIYNRLAKIHFIKKYHKTMNRIYRQKIIHETLSFQTYDDLALTIKQLITKIPTNVDKVVGIPRSGMIPAYMIGAFLNKRVYSLDEYILGTDVSTGERPVSTIAPDCNNLTLIIDDSISSGSSLKLVKQRLLDNNINTQNIIFTAAYATESGKKLVDYYGKIIEQPRLFQWNYLHHCVLQKSCVDIDGVLCVDPTNEENDDGEKYLNFLLTAKPLYIPKYKIYALVTSRLEKYRPQTEEWLRSNNIQYDHLYMLDLPTADMRRQLGMHAEFKTSVYSKLKEAELFIESEEKQAEYIALHSKKPVICATTDNYFSGKDK